MRFISLLLLFEKWDFTLAESNVNKIFEKTLTLSKIRYEQHTSKGL